MLFINIFKKPESLVMNNTFNQKYYTNSIHFHANTIINVGTLLMFSIILKQLLL